MARKPISRRQRSDGGFDLPTIDFGDLGNLVSSWFGGGEDATRYDEFNCIAGEIRNLAAPPDFVGTGKAADGFWPEQSDIDAAVEAIAALEQTVVEADAAIAHRHDLLNQLNREVDRDPPDDVSTRLWEAEVIAKTSIADWERYRAEVTEEIAVWRELVAEWRHNILWRDTTGLRSAIVPKAAHPAPAPGGASVAPRDCRSGSRPRGAGA